MKKQYDNRHKPIFFNKDDFVYLKQQQGADPGYVLPTREITKKPTQRHIKCRVIERVGRLAYRLQLPPQFAGAYPVISIEHPGVVDIPEDQWMTIPLVPGWESKLPKSKIYPLWDHHIPYKWDSRQTSSNGSISVNQDCLKYPRLSASTV